jgi:hypothetical protein
MVPVVSVMSTLGSWLLPFGMILTSVVGRSSHGGSPNPLGLGSSIARRSDWRRSSSSASSRCRSRSTRRSGRCACSVARGPGRRGARRRACRARAAAWTYVASAAAAIVMLLRVLSLIAMANNRGRNSR